MFDLCGDTKQCNKTDRWVLLYPNMPESKLTFRPYLKLALYPKYSQNNVSIPVVLFCKLNSKFTWIKGFSFGIICWDWTGPTCTYHFEKGGLKTL